MLYQIATGFFAWMANRERMEKSHLLRTAFAAFAFVAFLAAPMPSPAQVTVDARIALVPPAMPVDAQPPNYRANSIWTPAYWAYGPRGYHWVSGSWVVPPAAGQLWTPGYWGYRSHAYYWHQGYWSPSVGFYGGINYGYGYFGTGYVGGRWYGNAFRYNTAVTNVNRTVIHNTYVDKTVVYRNGYNHVSYNGGRGGIHAQPTAVEMKNRSYYTTSTTVSHANRHGAQSHNPPR